MARMSRLPAWYIAGAGGAWLNYVTWCAINQRNVDQDLPHFRYKIIKRVCPDYHFCYQYLPHYQTPGPSEAIMLGSHRAWINCWINVAQKYDPTLGDDWVPHATALYRPDTELVFNLEWCDIFENPEKFINTLRDLSGLPIAYDRYTKRAIEQYRASCKHLDLSRSELIKSDLVQTYIQENKITEEQAQDLLWTEKNQ